MWWDVTCTPRNSWSKARLTLREVSFHLLSIKNTYTIALHRIFHDLVTSRTENCVHVICKRIKWCTWTLLASSPRPIGMLPINFCRTPWSSILWRDTICVRCTFVVQWKYTRGSWFCFALALCRSNTRSKNLLWSYIKTRLRVNSWYTLQATSIKIRGLQFLLIGKPIFDSRNMSGRD